MSNHPADGNRRTNPPPEAVLLRSLEQAPVAYAATRGPAHTLFFANAAFRQLAGIANDHELDRPFHEIFAPPANGRWVALLNQAARGHATALARLAPLNSDDHAESWSCTLWPVTNANGEVEYSVIEVRDDPAPDETLRNVAEQLLLSSLRETDHAETAEKARGDAVFLSDAAHRLAESRDVDGTRATVARLGLPHSWCVVDIFDRNGSMGRLAIIHPDERKQKIAAELNDRWQPAPDDFFGLPLASRIRRSQIIARVSEGMLISAAHDADNLRLLNQLEFHSLLVVPLTVRGAVIGAVTFIKGQHDAAFTDEDIELAEDLSRRSALALDNARMYEQAEDLRSRAEASSHAKSEFLKRMSHELRTPLNAIGGYIELIDMGLHGPVTPMQHADLDRIKQSNNYLLTLITEILDYTRVTNAAIRYNITDVSVMEAMQKVTGMLESLADRKQARFELESCPTPVIARADPDRLEQIMINLLSNAIKHSPPAGGQIHVACEAIPDMVEIRVTDNGPGIPANMLESIFDPFVQIGPVHTRKEGGVGLGLAISRDLAIGMGGQLTARSTVGKGSCFILDLPRAS